MNLNHSMVKYHEIWSYAKSETYYAKPNPGPENGAKCNRRRSQVCDLRQPLRNSRKILKH